MDKTNKVKVTLALALPVLAFATYMAFAPNGAIACGSNECNYASQCYGNGACVSATCSSPQCGQSCNSGTWSECTSGCC
jgi:hypothetical protein